MSTNSRIVLSNVQLANYWGDLSNCNKRNIVLNHKATLAVDEYHNLYSYGLLIGKVIEGKKVVYNHTAVGGSYYSNTTSQHVGLAKIHADEVVSYNE